MRMYLELAAVLILSVALWYFGFHERQVGEAKIRAEDSAVLNKQLIANAALEAQWQAKSKEASDGYEKELSDLKLGAAPAPIVRLCVYSTSGSGALPTKTPSPTGTSGSPTVGGVLPTNAQPADIGGQLFALADRADQLSAQVRALQEICR